MNRSTPQMSFWTTSACWMAMMLGLQGGCDLFQIQAPTPPSAEARAAMQAEQKATEARAAELEAHIQSIRDRQDERKRESDFLVVQSYHEWTLQESALDSLGRIGASAVPELRTALGDPRKELRIRAAQVLARIGPEAEDAVPDLIERLKDVDPAVRKAAARALGQIGPAAKEAVPALMELLEGTSVN